MDIRIYTQNTPPSADNPNALAVYNKALKDFAYVDSTSELEASTGLVVRPTTRLETIGGKVAKYMLTTRGSDAFDPEYGVYYTGYTNVSSGSLSKLRINISSDTQRCETYIKTFERSLPETIEKLSSIKLLDIRVNRKEHFRLDIYLKVVTTFKNSAIVSVNPSN